MKVGDIVCMPTVKPRISQANGKMLQQITYNAPKGTTFILLLLGTTALGAERDVDPEVILREWGWTHSDDLSPTVPTGEGQ